MGLGCNRSVHGGTGCRRAVCTDLGLPWRAAGRSWWGMRECERRVGGRGLQPPLRCFGGYPGVGRVSTHADGAVAHEWRGDHFVRCGRQWAWAEFGWASKPKRCRRASLEENGWGRHAEAPHSRGHACAGSQADASEPPCFTGCARPGSLWWPASCSRSSGGWRRLEPVVGFEPTTDGLQKIL